MSILGSCLDPLPKTSRSLHLPCLLVPSPTTPSRGHYIYIYISSTYTPLQVIFRSSLWHILTISTKRAISSTPPTPIRQSQSRPLTWSKSPALQCGRPGSFREFGGVRMAGSPEGSEFDLEISRKARQKDPPIGFFLMFFGDAGSG